jgi:hypothetical protein
VSSLVPSDSDPEVRAHVRFDRIVCSNLANNAAAETSPLVVLLLRSGSVGSAASHRSKGKATSSSRASVFKYGRGIEFRLLADDRPHPLRP